MSKIKSREEWKKMDMTVVATTSIICVTLIVLNVIWIFKDRVEKQRIEAETRDKELLLALKQPGRKR